MVESLLIGVVMIGGAGGVSCMLKLRVREDWLFSLLKFSMDKVCGLLVMLFSRKFFVNGFVWLIFSVILFIRKCMWFIFIGSIVVMLNELFVMIMFFLVSGCFVKVMLFSVGLIMFFMGVFVIVVMVGWIFLDLLMVAIVMKSGVPFVNLVSVADVVLVEMKRVGVIVLILLKFLIVV